MAESSQSSESMRPRVRPETGSSSDSDSESDVPLIQGYDTFTERATGTGFIYHEKMAEHKCEWDAGYPENPQRLIQPYLRCVELKLVERCKRLPIQYATEMQIIWKHTMDHLQLARSTANMTLEELMALAEKYDAWYANKVTYEASLIAAGSTISMVQNILQDKINNGFAMVRPPGHHAMEQEFNGYCTFNNVALAAQFALNSGIERILIVDWDVHHGQGTQRMFYEDPRVLYFSIHRYEHGKFWPNLRESDYDYIGKGPGEGFNINIPLNKTGMTDSDYMAVFNMVLLPVAYEFQPQLILISSGYDAAVGCPEGEMLITPAMYAQMTHLLMGLAAGRVCVVLEGGYCLKSLAEGCALTLRSLLRDPCPVLPPFKEPSDSMMTTILNVIKILRTHWNCFRHFETLDGLEVCIFADVNNIPPATDVTFSTLENRPEKFQIMNCYPVQEEKIRVHYSDLISKLIAEADLSVAENKCCYVFDSEMRSHRNLHDKSHPERPERISKIYSTLAELKLLSKCLTVASRLARKAELLWIHDESYLNELLSSQTKADDELKDFSSQHKYSSTYIHQKSVHCALLSCGSLLNVVEAVLRGKAQSGVAIVRPPGHHAESKKAMGFCFFNNVAIAAKFAQVHFGLKRILILDWDVHHGNATQHQFYSDPSVLYISLHRYDNGTFFPGSSDADMKCVGSGPGAGYNVNIPWSNAKMGNAEYIAAFTQIIMPIAYQFAPELVLVSAGFDCAVGDPLGGYNVTPACFGHMTHMLTGLANGRVVLSLEGGYNLNSISYSMASCMAVLLGHPIPNLGKLVLSERGAEIIHDVLEIQKKYWSSLKGFVPIPSVRKAENGDWIIEKEPRRMSTRKSGGTKSVVPQISRPRSADQVQRKKMPYSSSDTSVTTTFPAFTATSNTPTSDIVEQPTTLETSGGTFASSGPSNKNTTSPSETTEESAAETSSETLSTSVSSSESDRNESNITAGVSNADNKERSSLSQAPEVLVSSEPQSRHEEDTSQKIGKLISGIQNLAVADRRTDASFPENASHSFFESATTIVKPPETKASKPFTAESNNSELKSSQKLQSHSAPVSASASVEEATVRTTEITTPSEKKFNIAEAAEESLENYCLSKDSGDATCPSAKITGFQETPKAVFRSLIYGDEPDPEPLSIFADNSQEQAIIAKERVRNQNYLDSRESGTTEKTQAINQEGSMFNAETFQTADDPALSISFLPPGSASDGSSCMGALSSSINTDGNNEMLGACGGSTRPNTVQDLIKMQGVQEMHAVQPLTWCPHLTEIRPVPMSGLNLQAPCGTCGDVSENWVCLTCYAVECSRFVNEHMLIHKVETGHNMVLSFSDLSVWCYGCDHYVDNEILFPIKNAAHEIKFGETLTQIP